MELAKLRYFYTVAKLGHVTRAAEEIHIAQPALTKAIKQLEEELDAPLFYKSGRNIRLTPFGVYLKNKLEPLLRQIDDIPAELESLKKERERTVKLNVLAASTMVTDALVAYKKRHPDVIFQMIRSEAEPDCDVSLSTASDSLGECIKSQSFEEKIFLAVPKSSSYADRGMVALNEMKDEGFVHLGGSRSLAALCDKLCLQAGFKPHIVFESDSLIAVKNVIGANVGVGFWPEYSWGKVSSDVALLPIAGETCKRTLTVRLHESSTLSTVTEEFYEYLVKFLQKRQRAAKS